MAANAYEIPLNALSGEPLDLSRLRGRATLVVNVASRCGLTPQYAGLQLLYERYHERGLVVLGTPCNQFAGQEPGTADEIAAFCSTTYPVTFPLTEKIEVNGQKRHPLYELLTTVADESGAAGDVAWNFEKFLVSPQGEPVARFRSTIPPEADGLLHAIEEVLPNTASPGWLRKPARDVAPGDRVRLSTGVELTASRIEDRFLGRDQMICLIEDGPSRWFAQPVRADVEIEVLSTSPR
jgi:glutathione peroxidase